MFSFLINFFSKFTWKQNLLFFAIVTVIIGGIGYYLYFYHYRRYIKYNEYNKMKVKDNVKEKVSFLKKNNLINSDNIFVNYYFEDDDNLTKEQTILKDIRGKYSPMITDEFFINNKLNKVKKLNFDKNKGIPFVETGKKAFNLIAKKLFINDSMFIDDGCLVILGGSTQHSEGTGTVPVTDVLYCDVMLDYKNYAIGIVFLPFHKVFYPNNFYKSEEEFLNFKQQFSQLISRARSENIFIFQVPEKLYNLEYDEVDGVGSGNGPGTGSGTWSYQQNYTPAEEQSILEYENIYITFLSNYFEKVMKGDDSFKIFMGNVSSGTGKKAKIFY